MKTIVVTGAAQGVGLATASLLAQRDYRVILLDLQPVDEHVDRLRSAGAQVAGLSRPERELASLCARTDAHPRTGPALIRCAR